jgi:hypothetical protein
VAIRARHSRKLFRDSFFARQNAASDCPLASNFSTSARHSDSVRRIRPSDSFFISFLLKRRKVYAISRAARRTSFNDRLRLDRQSDQTKLAYAEEYGIPLEDLGMEGGAQ